MATGADYIRSKNSTSRKIRTCVTTWARAAHLIHGSSDGRFSITYAVKEISQAEIEGVGFRSASYDEMTKKYDPEKLHYGYNTVDGEEIYYIPNPALGLWMNKEKL